MSIASALPTFAHTDWFSYYSSSAVHGLLLAAGLGSVVQLKTEIP